MINFIMQDIAIVIAFLHDNVIVILFVSTWIDASTQFVVFCIIYSKFIVHSGIYDIYIYES